MKGIPRATALLGIVVLVAAACSNNPSPSAGAPVETFPAKPAAQAKFIAAAALERFSDCGAVTETLRTKALKYVGPYGLATGAYGGFRTIAGAAEDGATRTDLAAQADTAGAAEAPAAAAPKSGTDFSETNVQEAGVDEPDTVETDGERLFTVAGNTLRSALLTDRHARLVGKLELKGHGTQLLLAGDRLIVLGGDEVVAQTFEDKAVSSSDARIAIAPAYQERTLVQILDVSDPAAMKVLSTLHLDGGYVSARAVDGIARIVVRRSGPEIGFAQPQDGTKPAIERAITVNKAAVSRAKVEQWIPAYELESDGETKEGRLSSCESTYAPVSFGGFSTVTVVTVDPNDPAPREGSTVVGGGDIVYASRDSLYVTSMQLPAPVPLAELVGAPDTIRPLPDQTQIHKFDIKGASATYLASGVVRGSLLNQFAMSEHEGRLRVASTNQPVVTGAEVKVDSQESGVTVLEQHDKGLVQIGHVGGLGKGEQIHAVRFIGAVGYVVTFKQVDPLYTIDLSNPSAPKVAGELKVPGYSAYLHPVSEGLILGVGRQTDSEGRLHDDQGRNFGVKLSLFDVSDPAKPREVKNHIVGGGSSNAEFDHHAFLYWGPRKLAVLPIQIYEPNKPDGQFAGAVALTVDEAAIKEVKRLSHPTPPQPQGGQTEPGSPGSAGGGVAIDEPAPDIAIYNPGIERSLVAANMIITVSQAGILASDLSSFEQRAWLPFA